VDPPLGLYECEVRDTVHLQPGRAGVVPGGPGSVSGGACRSGGVSQGRNVDATSVAGPCGSAESLGARVYQLSGLWNAGTEIER
jgi:hypothetical protein